MIPPPPAFRSGSINQCQPRTPYSRCGNSISIPFRPPLPPLSRHRKRMLKIDGSKQGSLPPFFPLVLCACVCVEHPFLPMHLISLFFLILFAALSKKSAHMQIKHVFPYPSHYSNFFQLFPLLPPTIQGKGDKNMHVHSPLGGGVFLSILPALQPHFTWTKGGGQAYVPSHCEIPPLIFPSPTSSGDEKKKKLP